MRSPAQLRALAKPPTRMKRRNEERSEEAFAFAYHSVERVVWVQRRPCAWCLMLSRTRITFPSDNAHTEKRGARLKGHYSTVVELCRPHHIAYDEYLKPFDKPAARILVATMAKNTARAWQLYTGAKET